MGGLTILDLSEAKREVHVLRSAQDDQQAALVKAAPVIFPFQSGGTDPGYRRLSSQPNVRDLLPPSQERMQRVAYYLFVTNNVASRCIEIQADFICGEGVQVRAEDPGAQEVLDGFWHDPWNDLDKLIPQMCQQHSVFGETLIQAYTNSINGQTRIAVTDPMWIDAVEYATLAGDPGRASGPPLRVILRRDFQEKEQRALRVIQVDEDPESPTWGELTGEAFYWANRKARAATRGISDLFRGADLFDAHDQFVWAVVEQARSHGAFIWDVLMRGATQEQIDQWLKEHPSGPRSGAVRAHNEQIEWTAVNPQIHATDKTETGRLIRNTIIGGFGFPEHWFADGANANRATALEMGEPALKMLTRRQRDVKFMLEEILRYVLSAKIAAGALPESVSREFDVQMPELSVRDQSKIAAAAQAAVSTLSLAKHEGWVDDETAAAALAAVIQQLGVEYDAEAVRKKAREEWDARRMADFEDLIERERERSEGAGNGERGTGNPGRGSGEDAHA